MEKVKKKKKAILVVLSLVLPFSYLENSCDLNDLRTECYYNTLEVEFSSSDFTFTGIGI